MLALWGCRHKFQVMLRVPTLPRGYPTLTRAHQHQWTHVHLPLTPTPTPAPNRQLVIRRSLKVSNPHSPSSRPTRCTASPYRHELVLVVRFQWWCSLGVELYLPLLSLRPQVRASHLHSQSLPLSMLKEEVQREGQGQGSIGVALFRLPLRRSPAPHLRICPSLPPSSTRAASISSQRLADSRSNLPCVRARLRRTRSSRTM